MAKGSLRDLIREIDFRISEVFQLDFFLGACGGAGGVVVALNAPKSLPPAIPVAAGLLGVVVGAVIAGAALQSAFLDQAFLRKIRAIGESPVRYLSPFLFTATIGVFASQALIALSVINPEGPPWLLGSVAGLAGFLTCWSIASLLPCLSTVVQFIHLKVDALDVPDDVQ